MGVTAIVLAAGEGTRMKSSRPKVVHEVLGKSMVRWVVDAARTAGVDRCVVVVGNGAEQVEALIGHAVGGVCPFGVNPGVTVYLDESLRRYDVVYPAAGNDHSGVRLSVDELYRASGAQDFVDVTK